MTRREDKLLDAFLDDLGSAPVPPGLARSVTRRIHDERPVRSSRFVPWMAAAAVIVIVAGFAAMSVAGPSPSPTPSPSVSPTPAVSPDVSAREWGITVDPGDPPVPLSLVVVDYSGGMTGVDRATVTPWPEPPGAHALGVGPGDDGRSVTVSWIGGVCDERAQLELGADGRTLTLRYPPRPSCDAVGIGFAVQLRFAAPADPAGLAGTWTEDLISPEDVRPAVLAFAGPQDGFVAGTTPGGDAVILDTGDGGRSWRVAGLGSGDVTDVGIVATGEAWAGRDCPAGPSTCVTGRYRFDSDGTWGRAAAEVPLRLSFAGPDGAALLRSSAATQGTGVPAADLALTHDGGDTWSVVPAPCTGGLGPQDVSRVDASTVVVLCESEGFTGSSSKTLYRSADDGRTWTRLSDGPSAGTGMHLSLRIDGTGWLWGARSPLLATRDGGRTWSALGVADGDARIVQDADAWGGGAGVALVWDPDRQATLLLRTADGATWAELFAWPTLPR